MGCSLSLFLKVDTVAFDTSTLASLRETFRVRAGLNTTDPRLVTDAISIFDEASTNFVSSTVEKIGSTITFVGNSTGTQTINISGTTTIQDVADTVNGYSDGKVAVVLSPDPDSLAIDLLDRTSTSILNTLVIYKISDSLLLNELLQTSLSVASGITRNKLFDDGVAVEQTDWNPGEGMLITEFAPVNKLDFFSVEANRAFDVTYSGTGVATIEVTDDSTVLLRTRPSGGTTTETEITLSDSKDVSDIVTEISAVSNWTATTVQDGNSLNLVVQPTQKVNSNARDIWIWIPADEGYRLDRKAGIIYFDDLGISMGYDQKTYGQVKMRYDSGYNPLPSDLVDLIIAGARGGLDSISKTEGITSERLGDYSYTVGVGSSPASAISTAIKSNENILNKYSRLLP